MAEKKISYTARDFQGVRTELINFTRTYYPDLVQNFNDASILSVFLDLNAAIADNLHFHIEIIENCSEQHIILHSRSRKRLSDCQHNDHWQMEVISGLRNLLRLSSTAWGLGIIALWLFRMNQYLCTKQSESLFLLLL